ncbi:rifampicin phosphotransferase-like, partial [Polyergus mexicanus]|uniref:rifampicin phosphotransferase-like n=1 Tax=Polyergus mexicanus TaxID=615972 RepID=UPI0038B69B25
YHVLLGQCRGDTFNEDNVEYIRLNFIFIGKSRSLKWPGDWSIYLHADALAREPWKNPNWMHKIKLIDYTGFDLWGSIIGQITFKDKSIDALYLRGLCQRRWGKHESYQFYRTITFFGITRNGMMYYLGVSDTKYSFSHMQFGHLEEAGGTISKIDWTDLKLSDFEKGDSVPMNYKIAFTAARKNYEVIINCTVADAITYYNDQSYYWACTTRNLHVHLNDSRGVGLMTMCCPYTGSKQIKIPVIRVQYLTQPDTFAQKDRYILHFADKQCQNENIVGGKAYSLAVLTSVVTDDFIAPQGFCVTSLALERQLQYHKQLQDLINDIIDISHGKKKEDLKTYCQKTVSIIQTISVEEQIKQAVLKGLEKLEMFVNEKDVRNLYAVRSSAVGEDSEETSAAGQNSTYLGVKNANDAIKCVAKCWASLFSYQSVEYRRQNGLPIKVSMGVCIQRMIDAETADVMFTRHPITGDPSSITITANYGLGETVVSGTIEPDTITIHRKLNNTLTIDTLVSKGEKILLKDDVVIKCTLSKQETRKISISDATALRLAKIGLRLESLFGSARDVEWAVVGERIFLLQARPITTINAWTDFELMHELDSEVPSDIDLITFANVEEVLPHPISPLSSSTIVKILNLSIGAKYNLDCTYLHMVRMKCAINYFNSTLRDVDKEITIVNKMIDLALCGRVVMTPEIHQFAVEKYGVASRWRKMYLMYDMFKTAWMGDAIIKAATDVFNNCTLNANEFDTSRNLYSVINKKYKEFFRIAQCHNAASMMNISYQMIAMSFLTKGSDNFTSDHLADIAVLLSSCSNVISTEVSIALGKIAACIRKNGMAEEFSKVESAKAIDWLKSNCPPAAEKLRTFFDTHGHRYVHELDLFAEPWIFKSDSIISTIQTQVMSLEKNYVSKTLNVQETIASLKTPMSSFTKWLLRQVIPLCRKAVTRREITKNILISAVHTLRLAYKHLGVLMVAESYIPDENLIFFLTHQEIGQLLNKHNSLLVRKALHRKKIYQQVAKFEYPEFSVGMPIPIQIRTLDTSFYEGCTKIEGTSICDGSVLSRACVITDLSEATNIQHGDILITHCTDIGWSPYFPLLGGIVTELGGLISHGAVVAREYGIPCIVDAKSATQVFQTGDTVLIAGGVLQLIKKA